MKRLQEILCRTALSFLLGGGFLLPGPAAGQTAAGPATLTGGKYTAALSPAPDQGTASGIAAALKTVPGIESAGVDGGSSSLQFTIRNGSQLDVATLEQAIAGVNAGLIMGTPQLATAQNPPWRPMR